MYITKIDLVLFTDMDAIMKPLSFNYTVHSMSLDMLRAPAWDTLIIIPCSLDLSRNGGPVIEATIRK